MAIFRTLTKFRAGASGRVAVCTSYVTVADGTFASYVAEEMHAAWFGNLLALQSSEWFLLGAEAYNATDQAEFTQVNNGGVAGDVESPQVAYLVRKIGGPRKNRGRWFVPGVPTAATDSQGNITGATVTAWDAGLAGYLADLAALTTPIGLLNGEPLDPVSPTSAAVVELEFDSKVATQRRRLRS